MKRVMNKRNILISFLMVLGMLGSIATPAIKTEAASETKGYLLLIEEKDGSWSSYENYVEVKANDKLMVKANDIAKAIGLKYKKVDAKNFTISNGKIANTYTNGTVKYKYYNGSKTVEKKAAYKVYTSAVGKSNMVEYNTLDTLVAVKYYAASKVVDYQKAGYQGVICFSKYNKITGIPALEEGTRVTTEEELQKAAADLEVSIINITGDITLTGDFTYEREENAVTINIKKGKTLTINKGFFGVGGTINNDGTIVAKGNFGRGICNLINNGSILIEKGGSAEAGMSDLNNNGSLTVAAGASLYVDRGSAIYNYGKLINEGTIRIDNGGTVHDNGGTITNNGVIDLYSYYNGDISLITGTGTVNDYREATE